MNSSLLNQTGKHSRVKSPLREYLEAILIALFAALLLRVSVVQAYHVPTGSMKNTVMIGDYLLVNKFIYGIRSPDNIPFTGIRLPHFRLPAIKEPEIGEIVVFKSLEDPAVNYVKRCVAVGGQTVEVRHGELYIDGKPEGQRHLLSREFDNDENCYVDKFLVTRDNGVQYVVRQYADAMLRAERMEPMIIPPNHFFMVGDNRDNSYDSRHWGLVPRDNVVGEAMVVYWSANRQIPLYNLFDKVRWHRIGTILH